MLFVVTGSSGSGKSTVGRSLRSSDLEHHDSDEDGVPSAADLVWRQQGLEGWVRRAATLRGRDLLLTGQSPLGEVLAAPSAPSLDAVAVLLLDVADRSRFLRLEGRDPGRWSREQKRRFVGWGRWHLGHAADPRHAPQVLTEQSWPGMRWDRWAAWTAADRRWCTEVVDTTDRTVEECARLVDAWVGRVRDDPSWPLGRDRWVTDAEAP